MWHRRSGKDKTLVNLVAKKMFERVGSYYYFFPTYKQGKKILWQGRDRDGFKFMDHIPQEVRVRTNDQEMLIEIKNGSIFQIIGTDNVDSVVGTNPVGCVFSEYSLQNPIVWGYIRPILEENGGWAVFNYTSRGRNHGFEMLEFARKQPNWFVQVLPATESGVFTAEQLARIEQEYIQEDGDSLRFEQEFLCSFEGAIQGSYYGKSIQQAKDRIKAVAYDPSVSVDTWWDLGVGDAMAIWFTQQVGSEIHVIDYLESEGEGIPYYLKELKNKPYVYGTHYWPHDGAARELTTGVSRQETAQKLGLTPILIVEKLDVDDGIQAVRQILPRCWFDEVKCKRGLECLRQYHKEYDEERKIYKNKPEHDWSSHGADAFRTLAVGINQYTSSSKVKRKREYQPMTRYGG